MTLTPKRRYLAMCTNPAGAFSAIVHAENVPEAKAIVRIWYQKWIANGANTLGLPKGATGKTIGAAVRDLGFLHELGLMVEGTGWCLYRAAKPKAN